MYYFENLTPGTYYIQVITPDGYFISQQNEGTDERFDSDIDQNGVMMMEVLVSNEMNPEYDAGLYQPATIGNIVWEDLNANGIQDETGTGIGNVEVILSGLDGAGNTVNDTMLTDVNGMYLFDDLVPGDYQIHIVPPANFELSTMDIGGNDTLDSDINQFGIMPMEALASGENNLNYDAGLYQLAQIGDYVWYDANANGIQDATEIGLENVAVILNGTISNGPSITDTVYTDETGMYMFGDLIPGVYTLSILPPTDYIPTYVNENNNDSLDSDINHLGIFPAETLTSGENNPTYDAGLYLDAEIGNLVWEDVNGNGLQDEANTGIPNVAVQITGTTGNGTAFMDTTYTDTMGMYYFEDLVPGTYQIDVIPPTGYNIAYQNEGTNDSLDSDIDENGRMMMEVLVGDEMNPTYDAGLYLPAKIGDLVWNDLNANGLQDSLETGIGNVTVVLNGVTGNGTIIVDSLSTDETGMYMFGDLFPGVYNIQILPPTDYMFTAPDELLNDSLDSDADNQGQLPTETLVSGENNPTYDAGLYLDAAIGNYVWEDTNGNGLQDETGTEIPNVEVHLSGMTGTGIAVSDTTFTDNDGLYYFDNLTPGTYYIEVVPPTGFEITYQNEGSNDSLDSDIDENGVMMMEILTGNEMNPTYDAGLYLPCQNRKSCMGRHQWEWSAR